MTPTAATAPDFLIRRFQAFIAALCRCVAAEGSRNRIAGPLVILIWTRLRRLATGFARLAANPAPDRPHHRPGQSGAPNQLPGGFAWLLRLMPATAAAAGQLRGFLADPGLQHLIAATPAAGRILRPLCHSLGIRPPAFLALPPRRRKLRPPPETAPAAEDAATAATGNAPSLLAPRPDLPGWPRAPGAMRFFPRRKFRT